MSQDMICISEFFMEALENSFMLLLLDGVFFLLISYLGVLCTMYVIRQINVFTAKNQSKYLCSIHVQYIGLQISCC